MYIFVAKIEEPRMSVLPKEKKRPANESPIPSQVQKETLHSFAPCTLI
jgi:hypothetical protein